MKNQVIINTEYFLQCAGSCAGCFLTEDERNSSNVNINKIGSVIVNLVKEFVENGKGKDFFVVGLGRGNNLQLPKNEIETLGLFIKDLENIIQSDEVVFEVSTSLIGKLDAQIEKAKLLLRYSRNIYFNIVVNSEITSKQFWKNVKQFHQELTQYRQDLGFKDKTGDILVLNVNPAALPDLEAIREFKENIYSPINISIFPFEKQTDVTIEMMEALKSWTIGVSEILKECDFNIKNQLSMIDFRLETFKECLEHINKTKNTYIFVDKGGNVSLGQPSIMGEVDYPRLLEKYKLDIDVKNAFSQMQKNTPCSRCEYQKECLITGAYLNMLVNKNIVKKTNHCPSGYKEFFKIFLLK